MRMRSAPKQRCGPVHAHALGTKAEVRPCACPQVANMLAQHERSTAELRATNEALEVKHAAALQRHEAEAAAASAAAAAQQQKAEAEHAALNKAKQQLEDSKVSCTCVYVWVCVCVRASVL